MSHTLNPSPAPPGLASAATPTRQTYAELQWAYDHFNRTLFEGKLPPCLITLQREKATQGYFSYGRFAHAEGEVTDEIALNPAYFAVVPLVETLQTLVHEMCHLWQHHNGTPGRGRYHNAQWAAMMERVGLTPSSTGKPGGQKTGDRMGDYATENGPFLSACAQLLTDQFRLSWYDRFPASVQVLLGEESLAQNLPVDVGGGQAPMRQNAALGRMVRAPDPAASGSMLDSSHPGGADAPHPVNRSNRVKYCCTGTCGAVVWGKPGLSLVCGVCRVPFD